MNASLRILHVEDDVLDGTLMQLRLKGQAEVLRVGCLEEARKRLHEQQFDAVILDLTLPDSVGPEGVSALRHQHPQLVVVVVQDGLDVTREAECLALGALEVLPKDDPAWADFGRLWIRLQGRAQALRAQLEKTRQTECLMRTVAHEIRTPLNGLLGFCGMLEGTALDQVQREYVACVEEASRGLLRLASDLLDCSRSQAGRLQIQARPFQLHECLSQTVRALEGLAHGRISLKLSLDQGLPAQVQGDEMRLRQVLTNLIGNACKFTAAGSVTLACQLEGRPGWLRFSVRDTGRGIPAEFREQIFQPFAQIQNEDERSGSGLGLLLSRQLVEAMGGQLDYVSQPGQGSEFWFVLPLGSPPGRNARSRRVLVVDDDRLCRKLSTAVMLEMGVLADEADSGEQALALTAAHHYDLVLIDLGLPDMSGAEVLERLRARGLDIPVLAVSGELDATCYKGFTDFLVKPVDLAELARQLSRHLAPKSPLDPARLAVLSNLAARPGASAVVREMLEDFLVNGHRELERLAAAVAGGNHSATAQIAHFLKGSAATIGARTLARTLQSMEDDPVQAGQLLPQMEHQFQDLLPALRQFLARLASS